MTQNQIAYHALQETIRSNKAREAETYRSNVEKEKDTDYINRAQSNRWTHQTVNDYLRNVIYAGDTIGKHVTNIVRPSGGVKSDLMKRLIMSRNPFIRKVF